MGDGKWNDGPWRGIDGGVRDDEDYPVPWNGRWALTDPDHGGVKVTGRPALGLRLGRVMVDGRWYEWTTEAVDLDDRELSSTHVAGPLVLQWSHTFFTSWVTRFSVAALDPRKVVQLDQLLVHVEVDHGVAWFHGAGSAASLVALPHTPEPVLGGRLRMGRAQSGPDGTIDLGAGVALKRTLEVQWRFDPWPTPAAFRRSSPSWLPETLIKEVGEPQLIEHADAALVADGLNVRGVDGGTELLGDPGAHPVELRDSTGTAAIEVCWAPDWADLLVPGARAALAGSRLGTGVPQLDSAAAGLVVRQAIRSGLLADPEEGSDALDALADRLLRAPELEAQDVIFLAGWLVENAETDRLAALVQAFGALTCVPGVGLAGTQLALACLSSGVDPGPVLARLSMLARLSAGARSDNPGHAAEDPVARAELLLVTGGQETSETLRACTAVAADLGFGLPGVRVPALPLAQRAQRVAVLELVPDQLVPTLTQDWGTAPATLVEQEKRWLRLALQDPVSDSGLVETLAWLTSTVPT